MEETLRFEAPVAHLPLRYAVQDIELPGGMMIRQGEAVLASCSAVGRHEAGAAGIPHLQRARRAAGRLAASPFS